MTPAARKELPEGWRWVRLGDVCEVSSTRDSNLNRKDTEPTTFVPMSAVDELRGAIARPEVKAFSEVKKGYTFFKEGDVLFAKITPCMQNGKHAIASQLIDGIGFGSTEFHVVRPGPDVMSSWVHCYLRQPDVLIVATAHFAGAVGQQRVPESFLASLEIPLPPLPEQARITAVLCDRLTAVERARAAAEAQLQAAKALPAAYVRQSLAGSRNLMALSDCLIEVSRGIGSTWSQYRVLGATRAGLALAKERVGKHPERYKLVDAGTIFYNPMRILLGSIAMVDEGDETGITSPDYVVLKTKQGVLHPRWFYYWLRSPEGDCFIKTLTRGAVRERMLFRRLAEASIELPPWSAQTEAAAKLTPVRTAAETMAQQLAAINALPAALLRPAFSGEL